MTTSRLYQFLLILTTMESLFRKPKRAQRVYKVECLNPERGISQSLRVSQDQRQYSVVLCLTDKTIKTVFPSEFSALDQMSKNRMLYKQKKGK